MKTFALVGRNISYSFSRRYFAEKFAKEQITDCEYINFDIPQIEELPSLIYATPTLVGMNVTIPYKEKVIDYLDSLSPEAKAIGAVNVIRVTHKDNKVILKGFNSDVIGFTKSIEPILESYHKKALILGTGGASKAIDYGLKSLGLETLFVSRSNKPNAIQYKDVTTDTVKKHNVIVNCTPLGMYPHADSCPQLPYEVMDNHTLLYDLIYNPDETLFMKKGLEHSATVKNGLEMLLLQAFASWEFWHRTE